MHDPIQVYRQCSATRNQPAAADYAGGRHLRSSMAVYCRRPTSLSRLRPHAPTLSRDATPLCSGRALSPLCGPLPALFSSPLSPESLPFMPTWPPPRPPRFMLSLAGSLAPHSCCTGWMDWSERERERGEGRETLRTGRRQEMESQAIIVRRPRTPALAQLHSVQIQNGGVPSNEPE